MMKKHNLTKLAVMLALVVLLCTQSVFSAFSIYFADAKEHIKPSTKCTLIITLTDGKDTPLEGREVKIYQVAGVTREAVLQFTKPFSKYSLGINGAGTQEEWKNIASTVEAYVIADGIKPSYTATSNAEGKVTYKSIPVGLYYVEVSGTQPAFVPFMTLLPTLENDGYWSYQSDIIPKESGGEVGPGPDPGPGPDIYSVVKQWTDAGHENRPESIDVEIYENGRLYDKIKLSEDNNWTYDWAAEDRTSRWTVVERNVPEGYTVTVTQNEKVFIVNNSTGEDPGIPPSTGDISHTTLYIVLIAISGAAIIIIGFFMWKREYEG